MSTLAPAGESAASLPWFFFPEGREREAGVPVPPSRGEPQLPHPSVAIAAAAGVRPGLFLGLSCWLRGVDKPAGSKQAFSLHLLKDLSCKTGFPSPQQPRNCPHGCLPQPQSVHVLSQPSGAGQPVGCIPRVPDPRCGAEEVMAEGQASARGLACLGRAGAAPQHQAASPWLPLRREGPLSPRVSVLQVQNQRDLLVLHLPILGGQGLSTRSQL